MNNLVILVSLFSLSPLSSFSLLSAVCSVRVIGESDIMQEFLSESDEVRRISRCGCVRAFFIFIWAGSPLSVLDMVHPVLSVCYSVKLRERERERERETPLGNIWEICLLVHFVLFFTSPVCCVCVV